MGQEDPLEEGMATHPSILAWRIPWIEEPGGLQSMMSQRVLHDWRDFARMHAQNGTHILHVAQKTNYVNCLKSETSVIADNL